MTLPDPNPDSENSRDVPNAAPDPDYRWLSIDADTLALYDPENAEAWIQTDLIVLLDP